MNHHTMTIAALLWALGSAGLTDPSTQASSEESVSDSELAVSPELAPPLPTTPLAVESPGGLALAWGATYASRYSFQGIDYSEGRPVFQPFATASLSGFTVGLWGNLDQTYGEMNEYDATLQHEFQRGRFSGSLGYAYLHYPNRDWAPSHETTLAFSLAAPFAPALDVHWDLDAGAGRYWTLGFSHEFEPSRGTLGLSAKLHAHEHYYGLTGFPALETGVSFSSTWNGVTFEPAIARMWAWENGGFRDDSAVEPSWVASLSVGVD